MASKPKDDTAQFLKDAAKAQQQAQSGGSKSSSAASQQALQAAIAAGPSGVATTGQDEPLYSYDLSGAGTGTAQLSNPNRAGAKFAPYTASDTLGPVTGNWSPEKIAGLQRQMLAIGLYPAGTKVDMGKWNPQDQAAVRALLTASNMHGLNYTQQLQEWGIRPPSSVELAQYSGAKAKQPLVLEYANPEDIRQAAGSTITNLTGGPLPAGTDMQGITSGYQQQQAASETQQYNAQTSDTGGSFTDAPSVAAYVSDKLRREHPVDVSGNAMLNTLNRFATIIQGHGS